MSMHTAPAPLARLHAPPYTASSQLTAFYRITYSDITAQRFLPHYITTVSRLTAEVLVWVHAADVDSGGRDGDALRGYEQAGIVPGGGHGAAGAVVNQEQLLYGEGGGEGREVGWGGEVREGGRRRVGGEGRGGG